MTQDPYFITGWDNNEGLSPPVLSPDLASLNPALLSLRRTALSFVGVLAALRLACGAGALCLCFLLRPVLGFRAHPWHLPTGFGSFGQVLDRGLAGFWGSWWHQTFRFGFEAPARWIFARRCRRHYAEEKRGTEGTRTVTRTVTKMTISDRLIGAAAAFLQSGFIHAAGSYTTIPETMWWRPPLFFVLAGVGAALQQQCVAASYSLLGTQRQIPRWVRRLGNLTFVFIWMHMTSWLLIDDFGRSGLWLYEPVPVSLFRALGYGPPGDRRVWRYDSDFLPRWHAGRHWWESGIAA